jgi:hypothetical protein
LSGLDVKSAVLGEIWFQENSAMMKDQLSEIGATPHSPGIHRTTRQSRVPA